ncbi:MAG: Maf family protein, partial [Geminicoccaceae bacterium]|nr:Maf family protein [Geminicoccaceae bacterium]
MGRIVLASASRARASMLEAAGVAVDRMPAAIDEHAIREALLAESVDAVEGATILAEMKGKAVLQRLADGGAIVLACDQLLVTEDG